MRRNVRLLSVHLTGLVLLLATTVDAQVPDGSIAEPGRWNGQRGTAAGTFRSAAMPILGAIEEAWNFALPGEAAGAPVLWDGVAYMLCKSGRGRELIAIDVVTGERRAKKTFKDGPLTPPVVCGGMVIVKVGPTQLIGYRLGRSTFSQRWKPQFRDATRMSDPLVVEDEVYVILDRQQLVRLKPGKPKPIWTTSRDYEFVGMPAAYGSHIFALFHDAAAGYDASLHIATFSRSSGSRTGRANVAWYANKVLPIDPDGASVSVMPGRVFVTSTAPLASSAGGLSYASMGCKIDSINVRFEDKVGLQQIVAPPSWNPNGSLMLVRRKGKLSWDIHVGDGSLGVTAETHQPALFQNPMPATVFGRVAYFGTWAADLETSDVLWRLPVKQPRFVAVPADRFVMVVDGTALRGFREKGSGGVAASGSKGTKPAILAVGIDGELLEGELSVSFDEGLVYKGKKGVALGQHYVVEDAAGNCVWAVDFAGRIRGYEFLARARLRETMARLAKDAAKAKADVAWKYFYAAEEAGLEGKDAERLEKKIRSALRKPKDVKPDKAAAWEAEAVKARNALPVLLAERAKVELKKGDARTGLRILRESLRRDEKCAPALALLTARAPKDFALGSSRFWLDMHLDLEASGAKIASDDELELKRARYHWRKDVYGLQAGPILMITPVKDTAVAGRCLAFGQMTCDVLALLFKTDTPRKRRVQPLMIHLFESRKEYQAKSGVFSQFEDPEFLKFTAGHYSPTDSVSRFFWFKDPAVERRVAATCVHELTHHWLREQNPIYASSQIRRRHDAPGHWIVEGFASFMEEGHYDVENGTWSLFNPRSRSLDYVLALTRANRLMDWTKLYSVSAAKFQKLPNKPDRTVVSRWMLGRRPLSERSVFYKQSSATCAYLYHAEDGKYRKQLLEFVVNSYMGKTDMLTPKAAFGMTAQQLGERIQIFAEQVAKGWEPQKQ